MSPCFYRNKCTQCKIGSAWEGGKNRHRRNIEHWRSIAECLRGDTCEYLHPQEAEILEEQKLEDDKTDLNQKDSLVKETQTDIELKSQCFCNDKIDENKLLMKKDRLICSFKKVDLSEKEWEDIEETV